MIKKVTCIECPQGCVLSVEVESSKVVKVSGSKCPKGEEYAVSEIENPLRILTSTVLTEGLSFKMIPVRTDGPLPKPDIRKAMEEIKRIRVKKPLRIGDVIVKNFLGSKVNLVATKDSF